MTVRVWHCADGSIKITRFTPGLDDSLRARACAAIVMQNPGATWEDVDEDSVPTDRATRHQWRSGPGRKGVIVDTKVGPPPHKRQNLLDTIDKAKDVDDLKAALKRAVTGT